MKKVLIVEDNKFLQYTLSTLISESGLTTVIAGDKQNALKEFNLKRPDLILLDKKLPDGDGFEVLKEIKRMDKELPVIMLTSYSDLKVKEEAISLGANAFINKPFDNTELISTIEKLLKVS
ncbi:MAG: response regulator [Bacteroidota bacterium]|nr:response regulator [Bacteroidota bacterium]